MRDSARPFSQVGPPNGGPFVLRALTILKIAIGLR
jgi:hypothetical protein